MDCVGSGKIMDTHDQSAENMGSQDQSATEMNTQVESAEDMGSQEKEINTQDQSATKIDSCDQAAAPACPSQIEELLEASRLVYRELFDEAKQQVKHSFHQLDEYGSGRISLASIEKAYDHINLKKVFGLLDRDQKGLNFWQYLGLEYILSTKCLCDKCGEFVAACSCSFIKEEDDLFVTQDC